MATKKIKGSDAKKVRGATDWGKVKSMTDEEIDEATKSDPNTQEIRPDELMQFKREKKDKR
jgi:hypothetical protein